MHALWLCLTLAVAQDPSEPEIAGFDRVWMDRGTQRVVPTSGTEGRGTLLLKSPFTRRATVRVGEVGLGEG